VGTCLEKARQMEWITFTCWDRERGEVCVSGYRLLLFFDMSCTCFVARFAFISQEMIAERNSF
jgi:hypothetical protein